MMRILLLCIFLLSTILSPARKQDFMFYKDTDRKGVPFAKDPVVVRFHGKYMMYYSVPPFKNQKMGLEASRVKVLPSVLHAWHIASLRPLP